MARPPPPSESDAVAGYRDVGFVLPPPAQYSHQEGGEESARRTRELSFGSISTGLGESPSPTPVSPGLGVVPEGAALGLDVSGDGAPAPTAIVPVDETVDGQEKITKAFSVFSIGVAPGEPTPARLRTRAASKGAPAIDDQVSKASDTSSVLAAGPGTVVDLTNVDSKWEFGTTNQAGQIGDATVGPPSFQPAGDASTTVDTAAGLPSVPGAPFAPMVPPHPGVAPYVPPVFIPSGAATNGKIGRAHV